MKKITFPSQSCSATVNKSANKISSLVKKSEEIKTISFGLLWTLSLSFAVTVFCNRSLCQHGLLHFQFFLQSQSLAAVVFCSNSLLHTLSFSIIVFCSHILCSHGLWHSFPIGTHSLSWTTVVFYSHQSLFSVINFCNHSHSFLHS